jgi:hypothetical protein
MHVRAPLVPFISRGLFECKSREERVVYKKLNSTETLIQRTTMEAPQQTYVLHRARRSALPFWRLMFTGKSALPPEIGANRRG